MAGGVRFVVVAGSVLVGLGLVLTAVGLMRTGEATETTAAPSTEAELQPARGPLVDHEAIQRASVRARINAALADTEPISVAVRCVGAPVGEWKARCSEQEQRQIEKLLSAVNMFVSLIETDVMEDGIADDLDIEIRISLRVNGMADGLKFRNADPPSRLQDIHDVLCQQTEDCLMDARSAGYAPNMLLSCTRALHVYVGLDAEIEDARRRLERLEGKGALPPTIDTSYRCETKEEVGPAFRGAHVFADLEVVVPPELLDEAGDVINRSGFKVEGARMELNYDVRMTSKCQCTLKLQLPWSRCS